MKNEILAFQSVYSLLQSTITIDAMINYAKEEEIPTLLLADKNVMYGCVEFYSKALAANILPHIGMQFDYEGAKLLLVAKNNRAYQKLLHISSLLNAYDTPTLANLFPYFQEMLVIVYEVSTKMLPQLLQQSACDFYISSSVPLQKQAKQLGIPEIQLDVINCLHSKDEHLLQVLHAIDENREVTNLLTFTPATLIPKRDISILASLRKATVQFDFTASFLPKYPGTSEEKKHFFVSLCKKGLQKRYETSLQPYHFERLQYEMDIIEKMGFIDYFLIIWDVMKFAKKQDIIIGPGRGSAVGSIVSYVLGITKIDPLAYGLIFERFLNSDRKTLPDIDIDVEDARRSEIIFYLREKYGVHHVAHILTFGTFGAKSAIRDVAKSYGYDIEKTNQLLKHIKSSYQSISKNIEENPTLQKIISMHADVEYIIRTAQAIEGFPRHTSTHAAGIILTDTTIENHVATIEIEQGVIITQQTMEYCERIGLLKIDFLGLRNLTIIRKVAEQIEGTQSVVDFIEQQIPENDLETFAMLTMGETTGIFQLESTGMRRMLQKFKIQQFSDITTVVSLYRPGPMQFIDEYIDRKNNGKAFDIIIPQIESVLEETYGIMVYQEQIMEIARRVGKMSMSEADNFRRAIAKKDIKLLNQQKELFIAGAIEQEIARDDAEKLFSDIIAFANYGFNKSHAVAYAKIAYQMAYLKVHHAAIFMTELINSVISHERKVYEYLQEAMRFGIKILPPDITKSMGKYTVENGTHIRMGLAAVKGVGKITITQVLVEREEQPFTGLGDILSRMNGKMIHTGNIQQLINAYAFNMFSKNQKAIKRYVEIHENGIKFQGEVVKVSNEIAQDIDDFSLEERMDLEQAAFGFSLFAHPLRNHSQNQYSLNKSTQYQTQYIILVEKIKEITTKNGQKMAFITVSDINEKAELVVFPQSYERFGLLLRPKKVLRITIRTQKGKDNTITKSLEKAEII